MSLLRAVPLFQEFHQESPLTLKTASSSLRFQSVTQRSDSCLISDDAHDELPAVQWS